MLLDSARTLPRPPKPARPLVCPWCRSEDIHGERPCPKRRDLEDTTNPAHEATRRHDWHCHACGWSARVGA